MVSVCFNHSGDPGEVVIRPGCQFPFRIYLPPRRLHASDQLLCLHGSVVVAHVVHSEVCGPKSLGHQRHPGPLDGAGDLQTPALAHWQRGHRGGL
jgi:hypothetical protein